jgi:hypothetical protein
MCGNISGSLVLHCSLLDRCFLRSLLRLQSQFLLALSLS